MKCTEIADTNRSGTLAFDLLDLLSALPPWARKLLWTITGFNARLVPQHPAEISAAVSTLARGQSAVVDWAGINRLATSIVHTVDGRFIGSLPIGESTGVDIALDQASIIIESVDSSYWRVWANNDEVTSALRIGSG